MSHAAEFAGIGLVHVILEPSEVAPRATTDGLEIWAHPVRFDALAQIDPSEESPA